MNDSVLEKIIAARRTSVAKDKQAIDFKWLQEQATVGTPLSISAVVKEPGTSLIAETKMSSPSSGTIRSDMPLEVRPKTGQAGQNWRTRPKASDARLTKPEVRKRMCDYVTEPRWRITRGPRKADFALWGGASQTEFSAALLGEIVEIYEAAGASALSILTEPDYFGGNWLHLRAAREFSAIPVLCKDFIIDEFQLYMARANGADAVLLIAAALDDVELKKLIKKAHKLEMEVLTEAINKEELDRVLAGQTDLVGINNRNLHTLKVDLTVSYQLLEGTPHDRPVVVESGIFTRQEVEQLEKKGADGILVGTALMESNDIAAKVKELLGKD